MARIRTIKPEFWTDSKTGTMTEFSKCLFLGLLNHADDYGVLIWDEMEWRAKIFPYHSDTTPGAVLKALTDEILPRGLLVMFSFAGDDEQQRRYAFIPNFHKHQVINKPSKPLLDRWKIGDTPKTYAQREGYSFAELGDDTPIPGPEHSGSTTVALLPGKERKGKERKEDISAPTGAGSIKKDFDDWYRIFPRKGDPDDALKAYTKARKQADAETLLVAATRYRDDPSRDPKFTKMPATWLNKGSWKNEPSEKIKPAKTLEETMWERTLNG